MLLSRVCEKVILVHRRDTLRAEKIYRDPLLKTSNVEFCWNQVVTGILQGERAGGIRVKHVLTGEEREIS